MSLSQDKPVLKLDWCSYEAAKYAVEHWHYSRSMPAGKCVRIGAWENERFIGAILFARGSNKAIGEPFGLTQMETCELVRVALDKHIAPVTRMAAVAIRMLRRESPGVRLIVSYADPVEGHIGAIYQAGNWLYAGETPGGDSRNHRYVRGDGRVIHWRTMSGLCALYGVPHTQEAAEFLGYRSLPFVAKHKYLMPLDDAMRAQIEPLRKPYPKRADVVQLVEQQGPPADGGANPTRPLGE
jgi:hypothetical protein